MPMKMTWMYSGKEASIEDVLGCVGPGWSDLIKNLINDLETLGWDGTLAQVKEKFGGLRFYIGSALDEVFDRITEAEEESYKICEDCGKAGKARSGGWIRTLCDECGIDRPAWDGRGLSSIKRY